MREQLKEYRTRARTGLEVSPLGLGVMTYGWGADKKVAREIFDLYREEGGNFFDTADMYSGGESESWLGEFVSDAHARDEVVIATKFSFNAQPGNPNAGGNGRKDIFRALEGSLKRLRADYVDVYPARVGSCHAGRGSHEHAQRLGPRWQGAPHRFQRRSGVLRTCRRSTASAIRERSPMWPCSSPATPRDG